MKSADQASSLKRFIEAQPEAALLASERCSCRTSG